jgi:N-acetylneuraminic acid mutarotase
LVQFIDPSWEVTPPYPISSAEPHGLMIGNDLIVFGGFYNFFTATYTQTYARDITKNNTMWRRMEDLPRPIGITHTPSIAVDQKVYMCGGYEGASPGPHIAYCFVYDHAKLPGTGQWTRIRSVPRNGTGGAGMIYDRPTNSLYYVGGAQRPIPGSRLYSVDYNNVWKYKIDDAASGWRKSTSVPYFGNHITYITAKDGNGIDRYYFLGGQKGEDERLGNLADVFEFIPQTETWIRRASMPFGRGHASASARAIGCGFIVAGGAINTGSSVGLKIQTADVSYYDIPTNKWTSIGNLAYAMVTPVVAIDSTGYMHFVDTRKNGYRRRISL